MVDSKTDSGVGLVEPKSMELKLPEGGLRLRTGGVLKRHLTPATLEKLLRNELCPQDENQKGRAEQLLAWITSFGKEADK